MGIIEAILGWAREFFFGDESELAVPAVADEETFCEVSQVREARAGDEQIRIEEMDAIRRRLTAAERRGDRLEKRISDLEVEHDSFIGAVSKVYESDPDDGPGVVSFLADEIDSVSGVEILQKLAMPHPDLEGNYESEQDRQLAERIMALDRSHRQSAKKNYWEEDPAANLDSLLEEKIPEVEVISAEEAGLMVSAADKG